MKLNGESFDIIEDNINKLKELFPEIVNGDNQVDLEALRDLFKKNNDDVVDDNEEHYKFTWWGKKEAKRLVKEKTTKTLRPIKKDSKNWDTTKNIYIEGDNLEAMKILLGSYRNKVKMIYIDPPYNTGNDFIYQDKFNETEKEFLKNSNQLTPDGFLKENKITDGKYHSNWLNMMYPRLKLARNLLKDDGVIFISIDDNEIENLKKICNEIFGEENFIATICQKSRGGISNDKIISENHNYQLFYAKNKSIIHKTRLEYGVKKTKEDFKRFNKNDNDGKGQYSLNPVSGPGGARKGNPYYNFLGVEGYFRFSEKTMLKLYNEEKIVKLNNNLYQKTYLNNLKDKVKKISTWWDKTGTTSSGTKLIKQLFPEIDVPIFDHPKPIELINLMIEYCNFKEEDIVLDFFSGSSTTAHAVMKTNSEENKNYKFIMIQIPEPTDTKSEALKKGYINICEIGKERIRRAGDKILEECETKDLDIGFKVFKVDDSNFIPWNSKLNKDNVKESVLSMQNNLVRNRSELDLIYELLLKLNLDLNSSIEEIILENENSNKIYVINNGFMFVCLDKDIDKSLASDLLELKEELKEDLKEELKSDYSQVILMDDALTDEISININETLSSHGFIFYTI